jgi:isopenicillin N synthase-like dioxygenase
LTYHTAVCDLAGDLMRIVALSLDLPEDTFEESYRDANPSLRLLHYPPRPADAQPAQIGAGAHTDWGGITILAQDDTGGLEVQDTSGAWIRATPIPGTFVVNLGDLIVRWTNDRYHSTPHRVFNPAADRDRYSMALFFSPNSRARIECLPTCVRPGEPPRYAVCTAGEHIAERRRETYGIA